MEERLRILLCEDDENLGKQKVMQRIFSQMEKADIKPF